jgi:hypothetical protein
MSCSIAAARLDVGVMPLTIPIILRLTEDDARAFDVTHTPTPPPHKRCRFVRGVYLTLCIFLDVLFNNRPIQRFWFLETVRWVHCQRSQGTLR